MIGCTDSNSATRFNESATVLRIQIDAPQTSAGGMPIVLAARHNIDDASVIWEIDPHSPGKLEEIEGDSVRYLPPAAGSIAGKTCITITATVNGITQAIELIVHPSPAAVLSVGLGVRMAATQASKFA
jgi:hypothetical protein